MQFPEITHFLPLKITAFCKQLFIADKNWERCTLVALSSLFGAGIGASTAAILGWNITVCATAGALIYVTGVIAIRILHQPIIDKLRQHLPVAEPKIQGQEVQPAEKAQPVEPDSDFNVYLSKAAQGSAQSQFVVGKKYQEGNGVEKNRELAIKYFTMAANNEKANPNQKASAHYLLGELYAKDEPVNNELAIQHLIAADCQNAKRYLCDMYERGIRVEKNNELKIQYLTVVANVGIVGAQYELGLLLAKQNEQEWTSDESIIKYFVMAGTQGHSDAIRILYDVYYEIKITDRQLKIDYLTLIGSLKHTANRYAEALYALGRLYAKEENYKLAFEPIKVAAEIYSNAQVFLGIMYTRGLLGKVDHVEAVKWYRKAADHKNRDGLYYLGMAYAKGVGVEADYALSAQYLIKAANRDHIDAKRMLIDLYDIKKVEKLTREVKIQYLRIMIEQENPHPSYQYHLALLYANGEDSNYTLALQYAQAAAKQDFAEAQVFLGFLYEKGLGMAKKDTETALSYYEKAMINGSEKGKKSYEQLQQAIKAKADAEIDNAVIEVPK